jgi:hypothetical protein
LSVKGQAFFNFLSMYYFYVLYSLKDGRLYKGSSGNIGQRFERHAAGGTASTKHHRPLVLIYLNHPKEHRGSSYYAPSSGPVSPYYPSFCWP